MSTAYHCAVLLITNWVKKDFDLDEGVEVKLLLARRTGPKEAKVFIRFNVAVSDIPEDATNLRIFTLYFRYYNGCWTTTGLHCKPNDTEFCISLMLELDQAMKK